jgi:UDP-N-acetylmuramate-alanine ligase
MQTFLDFANHVRHDIFIGEHCLWYTSFIEQSTHTKIHSAPQKQFTFETLLWAHNHANASLALACAQYLCPEVDSTTLQEDLATFKWLRRRWEYIWKNIFNVPIISDYAHHPSELASTLTAVQESYADQEITLIFQPHQARRVVEFWDAFISACTGATHTHIYTIYTARETLEGAKTYTMWSEEVRNIMKRIHSFDELWEALANKVDWIYHTSFDEIATLIAKTTSWVILICTAGDLDWQVRKLVQEST